MARKKRCPECGSENYYQNIFDDEMWICDDCGCVSDKKYKRIPQGCAACGGPYPDCVDSCDLMSDD